MDQGKCPNRASQAHAGVCSGNAELSSVILVVEPSKVMFLI